MEAQELDTISSFELWVPGHPITQGNKTAFPFKGKDGKLHVSMTEGKGSGKLKNWRSTIIAEMTDGWRKRLVEARKFAGLTVTETARRTGMSRQLVQYHERTVRTDTKRGDKQGMNVMTLALFAVTYGVTMDEVIFGTGRF